MPFSYLQPTEEEQAYQASYYNQQDYQQPQSSSASTMMPAGHQAVGGLFGGMPATAGQVPLQIPSFVFGNQSTLASGGGAEVLSAGMITPGAWFNATGTPSLSTSL